MTSSDDSGFKTMTVLVQKLVGINHGIIPEKLGPGDIADLLSEYLTLMIAQVRRHGGVSCRIDGDGITAFWIHDADQRALISACDCARSCLAQVSELSADHFAERSDALHLHVGVSMGEAIPIPFENQGQQNDTPYGSVVEIARSICCRIPKDESGIVVCECAKELLGDHIVMGPLEGIPFKGAQGPINVYRLKS